MTKEPENDPSELDALANEANECFDPSSRRALLGKIAKLGAASAPVALTLFDPKSAKANDVGSGCDPLFDPGCV